MTEQPAPILPRAALERVLLRAAELHSANADAPETMSEADLLALANEVGISAVAVKQALAEERMRVTLPEERGLAAALVGPAVFAAWRVVPGNAREVLAKVERGFQADENLQVQRRFPDRIVWGPRRGLASAMAGLSAGLSGRSLVLDKADEVSVSVVQLDATRSHVRIEALLHRRRTIALRVGIGAIAGGVGLGAVLLAINVLAPLAIGIGATAALVNPLIARSIYRQTAGRMPLAVEQVLDKLEFGEPKRRGLIDQLLIGDR